jgi:hypothetical protein
LLASEAESARATRAARAEVCRAFIAAEALRTSRTNARERVLRGHFGAPNLGPVEGGCPRMPRSRGPFVASDGSLVTRARSRR